MKNQPRASTEHLFTLLVEPDAKGRYLVKSKDSPGVKSFVVLVSGRGELELRTEPLSYPELLRCHVRLLDAGFEVGEPVYR